MKKKKALCVLLSLTMIITASVMGTSSVFAASTTQSTPVVQKTAAAVQNTAAKTLKGTTTQNVVPKISAKSLNSSTKATVYGLTYTSSEKTYVPVYIPKKGTFVIYYAGKTYNYGSSMRLLNGKTSTAKQYSYTFISSSNPSGRVTAAVSTGGTYYLEFDSIDSVAKTNFAVYYAPGGGTPTKSVSYYGSSPNGSVSYYKITAPSTGYITVSMSKRAYSYSSLNVKLVNYKKNAYTKYYDYLNSNRSYRTRFGVVRGTYYVAVKSADALYGITLNFTKVADKSGTASKRANRLYKGSVRRGVITSSQSTASADWYKFTVSKSQVVKFSVSTLTSYSGIKVSVINSRGSKIVSYFDYSRPSGRIQPYTIGRGSKLSAGTYYIKVQKLTNGNGYYKLTWLK